MVDTRSSARGNNNKDDEAGDKPSDDFGSVIASGLAGLASLAKGLSVTIILSGGKDGENDNVEPDRSRDQKKEAPPTADKIQNPALKRYNREHLDYYESLKKQKRSHLAALERGVHESGEGCVVPMRFRLLESAAPDSIKRVVLRKMDDLFARDEHDNEHARMRKWLDSFLRIPLGIFKKMPVTCESDRAEIRDFIVKTKQSFDEAIYGHAEAKEHIVRTLAKWISNPGSRGIVIGLQGPPGCGKTTLVKNCIAKALGLPMMMVPLGGMTDASILNGQQAVYENSTCGAIVSGLMSSKCMNPVVVLDELDKVGGESQRGQEVINTLLHMTDPVQNDQYVDHYFADVPIDLSKCLMVLTFNNVDAVNPILRDRMQVIKTRGYSLKDKAHIAKRHLLPRISAQHGVADMSITDAAIEEISRRVGQEDGVRNMERAIDSIVGNINLKSMLAELSEKHAVIDVGDVAKYVPDSGRDRFPNCHMYM